MDAIDGHQDPHTQPYGDGESISDPARRRVEITFANLQRHGSTPMCPRRSLHAQGKHRRARHHRHTESCRAKLYRGLREADSPRTKTPTLRDHASMTLTSSLAFIQNSLRLHKLICRHHLVLQPLLPSDG